MKEYIITLKVSDQYDRFDPSEIIWHLGACLEGLDLELGYATSTPILNNKDSHKSENI